MSTKKYLTYKKSDIALEQLNLALELYLDDREYISALTLAGAAEEILGKLVKRAGGTPYIDEKKEAFQNLYGTLFDKEISNQDYFQLENKPRNEMKHLMSGEDLTMNSERECGKMLMRAMENYFRCFDRIHKKLPKFKKKYLANFRKTNGKNV